MSSLNYASLLFILLPSILNYLSSLSSTLLLFIYFQVYQEMHPRVAPIPPRVHFILGCLHMLTKKGFLLKRLPISHAYIPLHKSRPPYGTLSTEYLSQILCLLPLSCPHTHSHYTLIEYCCCAIRSSFPLRFLDVLPLGVGVSPYNQILGAIDHCLGISN